MTTDNDKRMFIMAQPDELRIAITSKGILTDLDVERPDITKNKANIYKGRITSIEPSLAAVFVDYGCDRHGFLPFKEISSEYFLSDDHEAIKSSNLKKLLKLGQELVIQVEKEERGNKGAALSTFISLAGSYLVLMPNNPRAGGISRRVEPTQREHLQTLLQELKLPDSMGVIVRTAGVGRSKEELAWDLNILLSYWEAIKLAAIQKPGPYLIHQESNIVKRTIRDYLREDMTEIIIDNTKVYEDAREYVNLVKPDYLARVKLYQDAVPLFHYYRLEKEIETAYLREVRLPSGGSIVIDPTEALVAIDINSARATKGSDIEETARCTNLEAATEIARQLRLRDIGGLIVIDFIDMNPVKNQREVESHLRTALRNDRARIQVGKISRFGLLEMSRQRLASALNRSSMEPCPRCKGQGMIRSVESLTMSIIHKIQEQNATQPGLYFELQLPSQIAAFMINEKCQVIKRIERTTPCQITIIPNPYLLTPDYQMKYSKSIRRSARPSASYEMIKKPKQSAEESYKRKVETTRESPRPMIEAYLPELKPAPRQQGILKKILQTLKSQWVEKKEPAQKQPAQQKAREQSSRQPQKQRSSQQRSAQGRSTQGRSAQGRSTQGRSAQGRSTQGRSTQGRSTQGRSTQGRSTQERSTQERPTQERPTQERPTQERPTQERPTQERPTQERPTQERSTQERPTQERSTQERPTQERSTQERPTQERSTQERSNQGGARRYQGTRKQGSRQGSSSNRGSGHSNRQKPPEDRS